MKKKKNLKKKRRPNPLRTKGVISSEVYRQIAETMLAQGIGNLVLDTIDPLPSGSRTPRLPVYLPREEEPEPCIVNQVPPECFHCGAQFPIGAKVVRNDGDVMAECERCGKLTKCGKLTIATLRPL